MEVRILKNLGSQTIEVRDPWRQNWTAGGGGRSETGACDSQLYYNT